MAAMSEVTQILARLDQGDPRAAEQLLPLVYEELRKLAAAQMARENPGQTLQPTALCMKPVCPGKKIAESQYQASPPSN